MITMQYKIALPDHYDMNLIRQRVRHNGTKTDGFEDLLFMAYLIRENQGGSEGGACSGAGGSPAGDQCPRTGVMERL